MKNYAKEVLKKILIMFCIGIQVTGTVKVVGDLIHEYYKPATLNK